MNNKFTNNYNPCMKQKAFNKNKKVNQMRALIELKLIQTPSKVGTTLSFLISKIALVINSTNIMLSIITYIRYITLVKYYTNTTLLNIINL